MAGKNRIAGMAGMDSVIGLLPEDRREREAVSREIVYRILLRYLPESAPFLVEPNRITLRDGSFGFLVFSADDAGYRSVKVSYDLCGTNFRVNTARMGKVQRLDIYLNFNCDSAGKWSIDVCPVIDIRDFIKYVISCSNFSDVAEELGYGMDKPEDINKGG